MAKIVIGGQTYVIPELTFMALERAWPFVEFAMISPAGDPLAGPNAALRIIAAGILYDDNLQPDRFELIAGPDDEDARHDQIARFLRKKLKAREIPKLKDCIDEILVEAGLATAPGESLVPQDQEEQANLSPGIALDTSQSSLPRDAKAGAG